MVVQDLSQGFGKFPFDDGFHNKFIESDLSGFFPRMGIIESAA